MSVNRERPHLLVLPEDDRDRQLVVGFRLHLGIAAARIHILPVADGWTKVRDLFQSDYLARMESYPETRMVLLIGFDGKDRRFAELKACVPAHLMNRVFVLGVWTRPEQLKAGFKSDSYERIGGDLARDCCEGTDTTLRHNLFQHNAPEIKRLRDVAGSFLFLQSGR